MVLLAAATFVTTKEQAETTSMSNFVVEIVVSRRWSVDGPFVLGVVFPNKRSSVVVPYATKAVTCLGVASKEAKDRHVKTKRMSASAVASQIGRMFAFIISETEAGLNTLVLSYL